MLQPPNPPEPTWRDAARWSTFPGQFLVLAVARTFTHAVVLLEALAVFRGDPRIQVRFTCDDASAFHRGTADLLHRYGIDPVPWTQARQLPLDLVLTTSEHTDFSGISAPILVLPHGVGFQKYVPDTCGRGRRVSGVPRREFLDWPNLHMGVAHPAHREQLRTIHPGLAERATVVGDPVHDRLRASRRLRERYRSHLGVHADQRLVVLSSTWGAQGLLGRQPDLPERLLTQLPLDHYRLAAIVHPNTWFWHDPWQLRQMLGTARDAGLILVPPHAGWGATLVAADCLIGDHGSVTLHGAALDLPVLLSAVSDETVPATASARLAAAAPRLDPDGDMCHQVAVAIAGHYSGRFREVTTQTFSPDSTDSLDSTEWDALSQLAELGYGLLGLAAPTVRARTRTLPAPGVERRIPHAHYLHTWWTGTGNLHVERFPALPRPLVEDPPEGRLRHLAAIETAESATDETLTQLASVVATAEPRGTAAAREWMNTALERYPGALLAAAATETGHLVALRDGSRLHVASDPPAEATQSTAVVYARLRAHLSLVGIFQLVTGQQAIRCAVTADQPP